MLVAASVSLLLLSGSHTRLAGITACAPDSAPAERASALVRAGEVQVELAAAVIREDYLTAAALRDELATLLFDDEVAIFQANSAFYEAFSSREEISRNQSSFDFSSSTEVDSFWKVCSFS